MCPAAICNTNARLDVERLDPRVSHRNSWLWYFFEMLAARLPAAQTGALKMQFIKGHVCIVEDSVLCCSILSRSFWPPTQFSSS